MLNKTKLKDSNNITARELAKISRENRRITDAIEKQRNRKNVPESEYLTSMKDKTNVVEFDDLHRLPGFQSLDIRKNLIDHDLYHFARDTGKGYENAPVFAYADADSRAGLVGEEGSALRQKSLILIYGGHDDTSGGIALFEVFENVVVEDQVAFEDLDDGFLGDIVIGRPETAGGYNQPGALERQVKRFFHELQ